MASPSNTLEDGYVDFTGQTEKNITLTISTHGKGELMTSIVELPGTYNTGSSTPSNNINGIPGNYYGTVQISGQFTSNSSFVIYTTSPFYGRVHWVVTSN
jgi:hypothetical protein